MRLLLDANVIYPSVMREMLLQVAAQGLFEPRWSPRILEEWARAAARLGPVEEAQARGEIAVMSANWPRASVPPKSGDLARLWLPDEDDIHVLASAIAASADGIVTMNSKDFPKHVLAEEGLQRFEPDGLLYGLWLDHSDKVEAAAERTRAKAEEMSGEPREVAPLIKKARLPRLAKALR
jgi:predicted nucleic acid-binding protein